MVTIRDIARLFEFRRTSRPAAAGTSDPVWSPPLAGVHVDEQTALQYSAVYACVRIISETVASLPWRLMRRREDGGADVDDRSNLHWLMFQAPNKETSAWDFKRTLEGHRQIYGNGYAEIVRDNAGRPTALFILTPDRVTPTRNSDGSVAYLVDNGTSEPTRLPGHDIFHLRGLGFDGLVGYSPIALARQAIGLGIATEQFGAEWFGNGSHGSAVLESPTPLAPDRSAALAKQFERRNRGPRNASRVLVLEGGLQYKPISVPPDDAQFLQTRKFQVSEIARWYRVPPHKLADLDRATFSNIEHQAIEFVTDAIVPCVHGWEAEAQKKLIGQPARRTLFTRMSVQALLRGDQGARADYYEKMWRMGVLSPNEIRRFEDMNPIDDGDKHMVQLNLTTLEDVAAEPPRPDPPAEPEPEDVTPPPTARTYSAYFMEPLADALGRCVRKEARAMVQASERGKLKAKSMSFYELFPADLEEAVAPCVRALARCVRGNSYGPADEAVVTTLSQDYAAEHVKKSLAELAAAAESGDVRGLTDLWTCDGPATAAADILDRANIMLGLGAEKCHTTE